jgi:hypothetical protein
VAFGSAGAHIAWMDEQNPVQITCKCGAVFEVIETAETKEGQASLACVLCQEILPWSGYRTPQFHLVKHPDTDRD